MRSSHPEEFSVYFGVGWGHEIQVGHVVAARRPSSPVMAATKELSGGHQWSKRLLKRESFLAWMAQGTPEAANRYLKVRRTVASVVVEVKTHG